MKTKAIGMLMFMGLLLAAVAGGARAGQSLWSLDDGSGLLAADSLAINDAVLYGAQNWGSGYFTFNGSSYFEAPPNLSMRAQGSFRVSATIRTSTNGGRIWARQPLGGWQDASCELAIDSSKAWFHMSNIGVLGGTATLTDGQWHTVVVELKKYGDDFATLAIYVDGALDAFSQTGTANWQYYGHPNTNYDYGQGFALGARPGSVYSKFTGDMKDVRLETPPAQTGQCETALWRLDDAGGTRADDAAGPTPLTLTGNQGWQTGYFEFDGSSYFSVPYDDAIRAQGSFTVSATIRTTTNGGRIWARQPDGGWADASVELAIDSNKAWFHMSNVGTLAGSTTLTDGQWHTVQLAFRRLSDSFASVSIYVDGALDAYSETGSANWHYYGHPAVTSFDYEQGFCIGARPGSAYAKFDGDIKEVALYSFPTALEGQWRLDEDSGSRAGDSSGGVHNAALTGTANWGSDYFSFNGSSYFDVAYAPQLATARSFTIGAWVRTTASAGTIWARHPAGGWDKASHELAISSNCAWLHISYVGTLQGATAINDGQWHEVIVTFRRVSDSYASAAIFVDGELDVFSQTDASNAWDYYGDPANTDYDYELGLRMGASDRSGSPTNYLTGDLKGVWLDLESNASFPSAPQGADRSPVLVKAKRGEDWQKLALSCLQGLANRSRAQVYLDWGQVDPFWLEKFNEVGYHITPSEVDIEDVPTLVADGEMLDGVAQGLLVYDDLKLLGGKQNVTARAFGQWPLDDGSGTSAADASIYGLDAALTGTANWGADYFSFNGSSHFFVDNAASDFRINMQQSFCFKATIRTTSGGAIFGRFNSTWVSGAKKFEVYNGKLYFNCSYVNGLAGNATVNDGQWHDVAVSFDASTGVVKLYVDGALDAASASGAFNGMKTKTDTFDFYLGVQCKVGGAWYNRFTGDMKGVSLEDRAVFPLVACWPLTDGSGSTAADSIGSANASLTGTANWGGNEYFYFNGSSYLQAPYSAAIRAECGFTISAMIRTTTNGGTIWSRQPSTGFEEVSHELTINSNVAQFHISNVGLLNGRTTLTDGQWHTVTVEFKKQKDDYASAAIYVDGLLDAFSETDGSTAWHTYAHPDITTDDYDHTLRLGAGDRNGSPYNYYLGDIKQVHLSVYPTVDRGDWSMLVNVITAMAGTEDLIPVPARLAHLWPLPVVKDVTDLSSRSSGLWSTAYSAASAYSWVINAYDELTDVGLLAHLHPSTLNLRDYLVAHKVLPIFYWSGIDSTTEALFNTALGDTGRNQPMLGIWNPMGEWGDLYKPQGKLGEWDFMRRISPYAKYLECTGEPGISNLTYHSSLPQLVGSFRQRHGAAPTLDSSKVYVTFNVSDGDNLGYVFDGLANASGRWWDSADRGDTCINWTLSSCARELMPGIVSYLYMSASANDSFCSANGIGYMLLDDYATNYTNRDTLIRDFYRTSDDAMELLDTTSAWMFPEYQTVGKPSSSTDLPELTIAVDEMNNGASALDSVMLDYGRRSGVSTYADTCVVADGVPMFLSVTVGSESVADAATQIRNFTPTSKPAFLHVFLINWNWTPEMIEDLAAELGSGYVPVDAENLGALY